MAFNIELTEDLLVACHRRCCICHRFCGVKIELDHIVPKSDGGSDDLENAIPVCFECHAEINSYNDDHPRGRKFRPGEKQKHKQQWLAICKVTPHMLINAARDSDVGPLQAMIDELEYNRIVAGRIGPAINGKTFSKAAGLLRDEQFGRAISGGAISILADDLRLSILDTYAEIGELRQLIVASIHQGNREASVGEVLAQIRGILTTIPGRIDDTHRKLLGFLGRDSG